MTWTEENPKEDGFYWWRMNPRHKPEPIRINDGQMEVLGQLGSQRPRGRFRPKRILPPEEK